MSWKTRGYLIAGAIAVVLAFSKLYQIPPDEMTTTRSVAVLITIILGAMAVVTGDIIAEIEKIKSDEEKS